MENPDILAGIAAPGPGRPAVVVGFAAETGDEHAAALEYGLRKLERKGCDLLVVNRVDGGRGFEVDDNAGVILTAGDPPGSRVEVPYGPKTVLAAAICSTPSRPACPAATSRNRCP